MKRPNKILSSHGVYRLVDGVSNRYKISPTESRTELHRVNFIVECGGRKTPFSGQDGSLNAGLVIHFGKRKLVDTFQWAVKRRVKNTLVPLSILTGKGSKEPIILKFTPSDEERIDMFSGYKHLILTLGIYIK